MPRRSDPGTSSPWLLTCPGSLTVLRGSPLPPRRSQAHIFLMHRPTCGEGRVSLVGDVMFSIVPRTSPTPVSSKDLDFKSGRMLRRPCPTWAVLLGHQDCCLRTGHCHSRWLSPEVWLCLRLWGHLSEGGGVGARFSKRQGFRPLSLARGSLLAPWPGEKGPSRSLLQSPLSCLSWL